MFYTIYETLCQRKGVSKSRAAADMGLSNSTVTKWKKTGATPNGETLSRVAAYFGVSMDELVENTAPQELAMDSFTYALHSEMQELTPENREKLLEMARFFRQQQEKGKA